MQGCTQHFGQRMEMEIDRRETEGGRTEKETDTYVDEQIRLES